MNSSRLSRTMRAYEGCAVVARTIHIVYEVLVIGNWYLVYCLLLEILFCSLQFIECCVLLMGGERKESRREEGEEALMGQAREL